MKLRREDSSYCFSFGFFLIQNALSSSIDASTLRSSCGTVIVPFCYVLLALHNRIGYKHSISGTYAGIINLPSVFDTISSTDTPGALSTNKNPSAVTSITASSVTIFFTHPTPVKRQSTFRQ